MSTATINPPAHICVHYPDHLTTEQRANVRRLVRELSAALDPVKAAEDNLWSKWAADFAEFEQSLPDTMKHTPQLTSNYDFNHLVPAWAKAAGQQAASV